jgi:hypothetical protein
MEFYIKCGRKKSHLYIESHKTRKMSTGGKHYFADKQVGVPEATAGAERGLWSRPFDISACDYIYPAYAAIHRLTNSLTGSAAAGERGVAARQWPPQPWRQGRRRGSAAFPLMMT